MKEDNKSGVYAPFYFPIIQIQFVLSLNFFIWTGGEFNRCIKELDIPCLVLKLSGLSSSSFKENAMKMFQSQYVQHNDNFITYFCGLVRGLVCCFARMSVQWESILLDWKLEFPLVCFPGYFNLFSLVFPPRNWCLSLEDNPENGTCWSEEGRKVTFHFC